MFILELQFSIASFTVPLKLVVLAKNDGNILLAVYAWRRFTVINVNCAIGSTVSRITSTFVRASVISAIPCKNENSNAIVLFFHG